MGLRERKKEQTRAALVEAAERLFAEKGYDGTTVADIAAAANVSTRTFFGYFRAKEEVLFAGTDQRLRAIGAAFDAVQADTPLEAVRQILERVMAASDDLSSPDRLAVMLAKPELQAQALQRLIAAERLIAERLRRAYPDRLDDTLARATAGALVGALVGAVMGGIEQGEPPQELRERMRRALHLLEDGLRTLE
ncbi:TetR/AcrR family transcriptional regulator [Nonomuraea bangladeshensis]|uniref:TetR/AcrR family transcriptional regulator n=1 Tax=Nonomuraea bangladeshensis TaxID=404385 RepID=UPI003C2C60DB